jgi:hypothetical protein
MGGTDYLLGCDILGAVPKPVATAMALSPEQRAAEQVLADVRGGGKQAGTAPGASVASWPASAPIPPTAAKTGGWKDWLPLAAAGLVVIGAGGAWVIWKTKKARAK